MTVPPPQSRFFVSRVSAWGRENRRSFPWREERDPFRILVAEVLLQRSRGRTVARVYDEFFARWPSAAELSQARVSSIASVIRPLGLTGRAKTLKALAISVVESGGVPSQVGALIELPGVGRYAAHATAAVAFGRRVPTVDGVSARVYRRFFGLPATEAPALDGRLWDLVASVTPRGRVREWNWAVLDLAAAVCLPRVPRCNGCPLSRQCSTAISPGFSLS